MVPTSRLKPVPILTGPTASGKTALALELARRFAPIELINADSLCIYRGMEIGTAKPTPQERAEIPHHLIDVNNPDEEFTAGDFVRRVHEAVAAIEARGARALIVGGTGFYLRALRHGLWEAPRSEPALRAQLEATPNSALHDALLLIDPPAAARIGPNDHYRLVRAIEIYRLSGRTPSQLEQQEQTQPDPRFPLWVVDRDPTELEARITLRTRQMLDAGLVEEARSLQERFPGARPLKSVGYRETLDYLAGRPPEGRTIAPGLEGLRAEIELGTRQLARKQRKWFRTEAVDLHLLLDRDHDLALEAFGKILEAP